MPDRYICIHGHFYQPPREDPWLECVLRQESAHPYHDWNERVASECYAPNAAARILDAHGQVARTVNNYTQISFDFGPPLLRWLEMQAPETYYAILTADKQSLARFHGHGCAMSQAYSHAILPLLSRRDKVTEIRWGIADFVARFKRRPEGMWLPETAVDTETLEVLAEQGIRFTILAPHQARRIRGLGRSTWWEANAPDVDTSHPYTVTLSSGHSIAIFLFAERLWRAVTGEGLLHNGEQFAWRLLDAFDPAGTQPQLVHVATDGEMYGHHHRYGEMALAYALHYLSGRSDATLTNYGEFLERCPPDAELEIVERSSWSCPHGIERWRAECGCRAGIGEGHWQQSWRTPLSNALNTLRAQLDAIFVDAGGDIFRDPVEARDSYMDVVNGTRSLTDLVQAHASETTSEEALHRASKLLECQRNAAMMFTSCGWFFDEVSRVEPVQNLRHAARAMQLVREWADTDLEAELVGQLAAARSNHSHIGDGRSLWETLVRPAIVSLEDVVAERAVRSFFKPPVYEEHVYDHSVTTFAYHVFDAGQTRLALGHVRAAARRTRESRDLCFCVVGQRGHSGSGGVRAYIGGGAFSSLLDCAARAVGQRDPLEVVRILDQYFSRVADSVQYVALGSEGTDPEPSRLIITRMNSSVRVR